MANVQDSSDNNDSAPTGDLNKMDSAPTRYSSDIKSGSRTSDLFEDEQATSSGETFRLTPAEISRKKYFDQKAAFFRTAKWGLGVFLSLLAILVTVLAIFYAYNISNIAEPIGGIKVEIEHLKKSNEDLSNKVEQLQQDIRAKQN